MVFLAGHGVNDRYGEYYFLPVDVEAERLRRSAVRFPEITDTAEKLAGKVVVFLDTCHSGNVWGGRGKRRAADVLGLANELADAEHGVVSFMSTGSNQFAVEHSDWENGAFTEALVEGVGGAADAFGRGKITVNSLGAYVAERVKELTKGDQTPRLTIPDTIEDFPIAVKR